MNPTKAVIQDKSLLVSLIKKCTTSRDLKLIQAYIIRAGLAHDTILTSSLLVAAAITLRRHVAYAHCIFSWTHHPNIFMWNTLIRGYSVSNSPTRAVTLYKDMLLSGISSNSFTLAFVLKALCNLSMFEEGRMVHCQILKKGFGFEIPVLNGLMKLYIVCGYVESARHLFDRMRERDTASWSIMISGYAQNDMESEALALFKYMREDSAYIDEFTLASVAAICGHVGALDLGRWVHSYINLNNIKMDVVLGTSLVDMYSKCGSLNDALIVFQTMVKRDVTAWSAMIGGYAVHGCGHKALELFDSMRKANVYPNSVTFTNVLFACSHSGLLDEGCKHFDSMQLEYGFSPELEHYGCMVDLFCRSGDVTRAYEFIRKMPITANAVLWRTLLTSCKTYEYKELGECIIRDLLEIEPCGGDNFVLASNVYASLGKWSSVSNLRSLMKDKQVKKEHGWSSIELDFTVHRFVMGDKSHPENDEIYQMLDRIARKLKQVGHIATTTDVLHDIDDEEKENALGLHSERLAVAYALLRLPKESTIRVVKNLRVCRDCHAALKLISSIYKRVIIVRDRVRFHHFQEGKCSCNDYCLH
ncbi:pentatricopeptide repeat-containing protein At5g66520-like [Apium graveolens]|uniref:pentatricopeptide repeat-containing protein At5g66520-like n=1 Tax=Apium graveolens TaxID=4045 RepID=UPI003D7C071B